MRQPHHIINQQILEIHMPEKADVGAVQAEIGRLYREKMVPIINDLCDRYSAGGRQFKIAQMHIDLGHVQFQEIEAVFAQKFAEAMALQDAPAQHAPEPESAAAPTTPLHVLNYYLMTGAIPWWAAARTKDYLHELLDAMRAEPGPDFVALLRQVGQKKTYRERFIYTFSEAQILGVLCVLGVAGIADLPKLMQELIGLVRSNPERFRPGLTAQKVAHAFWAAVFAHATAAQQQSGMVRHAILQTLRALRADFSLDAIAHLGSASTSALLQRVAPKTDHDPHRPQLAAQDAIHRLSEKIRLQQPQNPLLRAFCIQLAQLLDHPLFTQLDTRQIQLLHTMLEEFAAAQGRTATADAATLHAVTGTNLQPLAKQLHQLEARLKQMMPAAKVKVMEKLRAPFDDTDAVLVQNAGLVILWPFLQRFFENLDLLDGRKFKSESASNEAVCALQYVADEAEDKHFEGQLALNKILCGIDLAAPIALAPRSSDDIAIAEDLLEAVISRGPHWKNLSLAGFRSAYLQREGLLRSRDGHWLLQVKKETHDITLEKLPWAFSTVKLPWMNQILMVEWI